MVKGGRRSQKYSPIMARLYLVCTMDRLGDNDRAARVLFVQAPEGAGRMMQSKPEHSEGFDVIIRPAPEGAGRTTPKQTGHYSHYNTKLTNSRYFHGNSYRIALNQPQSRPSCSWKSIVTIIATLRWASCGPGTGLQAHPLKSQYIFASSQEISIYDRILPWITRKLRIW